jgi:diguanylate cyclase with GGDEF domain/PucR-like helix-turn-helix protein
MPERPFVRSPECRRHEWIRRLLEGPGDLDGDGGGDGSGAGLDYDLGGWHLGVIAVGDGAPPAVRGLAAAVDRRLLSVEHGQESVWAWLGGSERVALGELQRALVGAVGTGSQPPLVLALGEPARGIDGWRVTHQQAQAALAVALRRDEARPAPTRYGDVALLASALKDVLLGGALIDVYLEPLEDSRGSGSVLRETLRAYLGTERGISSAAAALGVTRRTVENRLRTIEERLGRTLHPCPPELEVALSLDALGGPIAVQRRPPSA